MLEKKDPKNIIAHNRQVYNDIAPFFSAARDCIWDDLIPLTDYTKDCDAVLDLGCGNGRLYQILGKKQVHYVGMDQSEGLITLAKEKFSKAEFLIGEMSKLPLPNEKFDLIYCIAALNHIPGHELQLQCLKEMHRVLKPGGRLLMTNWNLFSDSAQKKAEENNWLMKPVEAGIEAMVPWKDSAGKTLGERYYHGFTILELENLFVVAGFVVEEQYYSRKGEKVGIEDGGNLVSIVRK